MSSAASSRRTSFRSCGGGGSSTDASAASAFSAAVAPAKGSRSLVRASTLSVIARADRLHKSSVVL